MTHDWFVIGDNGKEQGPFNAQQLKQMAATGKLQPDDKVRRGDMKAASKASSVKGLFATVEALPPKSSPSPPAPEPPLAAQRKGLPSKKTLIIASVVGGACLFLCCGGLAFFGMKMTDSTRKQLADGDALWDKGDKAGGAAKYRAIIDNTNVAFIKEEDRPRLYGRLIDFDYENGHADAGKALIDKADEKGIVPTVSHAEAKAVMDALVAQRARKNDQKEATDTNFTMEEQVQYIVRNNFGLTVEEADPVLHPGKEFNGLVYEEKDYRSPLNGQITKEKVGTLRRGQEEVKKLHVGPLDTDRRDPKIDYSKKRIHTIEALVREGDKYQVKTRWDFVDVISKYCRILKHPNQITDYDGTNWRISERQIRLYFNGQKEYECYGKTNRGSIDPRCFDKRNRYWDESGKDIDQTTYCEAGWGKGWQRNFFESEAKAGRRNLEQLLESMRRNGAMTDEQAKRIIKEMEDAGTIPRK